MKILAISCHPDDIEINCAGTLARFIKQGDEVTMCNLCNGNLGHMEIMPSELEKLRLAESKKSAAIIGANHICMGINDIRIYHENDEQRAMLASIIRAEKPDLIITHTPDDYMVDHIAVSKLAFAASFCASLPHYSLKNINESVVDICPIFYMDNLGGFKFEPTEYVDISDCFDIKLKMLECHTSQLKWMRDHDGIDFTETVKTFSRMRGLQSGVTYAEGFRQMLGWGRVRTKRLLP